MTNPPQSSNRAEHMQTPAALPRRWRRRVVWTVVAVIGVPIVLVGVLMLFEIPVSLGFVKGQVQAEASRALGRELVFEQPVLVTSESAILLPGGD